MRLAALDAVEVPRPLGVLKTLNYRPERFGRPYSDALDLAMRGPSEWSAGERELFAAFVSSLNQCPVLNERPRRGRGVRTRRGGVGGRQAKLANRADR